ncbi:MAG: FAD-binding protein [Acidimicrobiales bacterium]
MPWDYEYDVVIVGSGVGGFVGALAAQQHGLRPIILEKRDVVGGSSAMSGGVLWIPNNPLMKRDGVEDSYDDAMAYFKSVVGNVGPASSEERRRAYITLGPKMIEFLEGLGAKFLRCEGYSDYHDEAPGASVRGRAIEAAIWEGSQLGPWLSKLQPGLAEEFGGIVLPAGEVHLFSLGFRSLASSKMVMRVVTRTVLGRLKRQKLLANGASLIGQLLKITVDHDIPLWTGSPLVDLVEEDGRITGVLVESGNRKIRVKGNCAVLINAGGFAHNSAMRREFGLADGGDWSFANPGDTGEAIQIAIRHGAAVELMDDAWWMPAISSPSGPQMLLLERPRPGSIIVDRSGRRFVNEAHMSYMEIGQAMHRRDHEGISAIPSWMVFDQRHRNRYALGKAAPRITPKGWLSAGIIKKADTIEGLAKQMDVDPGTLRDTLERFNRFASVGQDPDFHRGERASDLFYGDPWASHPSLGPLDRPPYYAVAVFPGDVGTSGGVLTDDHARVLRQGGEVIPGLYASGNSTASVHGRRYLGAGASIAASGIFSYAAVLHAAAEAKQEPHAPSGP